MLFFSLSRIATTLLLFLVASAAASAEETMSINGTQLKVTTDYGRDVVIFNNDCGTQTLSRQQLLQGAIPSDLVPCPRSGQATQAPPAYSPDTSGTRWGAVAAGVDGWMVGAGTALQMNSETEARNSALASCRSTGIASCKVQGTFTGCGYISISTRGSDPSWGMGPTPSDAYDACYSRLVHGNCKAAIGGCN